MLVGLGVVKSGAALAGPPGASTAPSLGGGAGRQGHDQAEHHPRDPPALQGSFLLPAEGRRHWKAHTEARDGRHRTCDSERSFDEDPTVASGVETCPGSNLPCRLRVDHCGAHRGVGGPGSVEELRNPGRRDQHSTVRRVGLAPASRKAIDAELQVGPDRNADQRLAEHLTTTGPSGRVPDAWLPFQPPVSVLFNYALFGHYPLQETTPLPIPPGPYSQSLTLGVPARGPVTQPLGVDLTGYDATGRQVVCMQLIIPIK